MRGPHGVQVLGGPVSGSSLGGVALALVQAGDGLDQHRKADDEGDLGQGWIASDGRQSGELSGSVTQAAPGSGGAGNAGERCTDGPVEGLGRLA